MKKFVMVAVIGAMLAACGEKQDGIAYQNTPSNPNTTASQPTQQNQPVVVQQEQSSILPALAAGAIGYMLGSAGGQKHTQVIEREVVREVPARVVQSTVKPTAPTTPKFTAPAVPKPVTPVSPVVSSQPKPSYSQGGYSSVRQSAPTYRSPSFSSPVRSGRR